MKFILSIGRSLLCPNILIQVCKASYFYIAFVIEMKYDVCQHDVFMCNIPFMCPIICQYRVVSHELCVKAAAELCLHSATKFQLF